MKRNLHLALATILLTIACGLAQTAAPDTPATPGAELKAVLAQMDAAGAVFRSAQADIEWVQYTKAVDDKDVQSGQIFFRRNGRNMDVSVRVMKPHAKQVLVKDGRGFIYDPKTRQITERDLGKNPADRADIESLMNLGFGGRGQDLLKEYDVKLEAWETVDKTRTARLVLVAKSERLKQFFTKIILWIDPVRDVPLQQQRFESSGDYQLTRYSNIQLNVKIPDDKFRLN